MSSTDHKGLKPVSKECVDAILSKKAEIITSTVNSIKAEMEKKDSLTGEALIKLNEGLKMTIEILIPIMEFGDQQLLEDQLKWAGNRLPEEGFNKASYLFNFEQLQQNLKILIPRHLFDETKPYFMVISES